MKEERYYKKVITQELSKAKNSNTDNVTKMHHAEKAVKLSIEAVSQYPNMLDAVQQMFNNTQDQSY